MNLQRHIQVSSPGSVLAELSHFSQHILKPLVKGRLSERADRLQQGFSHRVPQLFKEHPEKKQHEGQESEKQPHVQAQVPAPTQCQRQRGGRHKEFPGGRHGVRHQPTSPTFSKKKKWSSPTWTFSGVRQMLCCSCRSHCLNKYPAGLAML